MPDLHTSSAPLTIGASRGRASRRRGLLLAAAVAAVSALTFAGSAAAAPAAAAPAPAGGDHYVALGDSYSSGAGVPTQVDTNCARSDHNYPGLVARAIGAASVTDVTCAGADTTDMAGRQGSAPPQLDALRPDTTLVSLGIGGNDLDLTGLLGRCLLLDALLPNGSACETSYTLLGTDQVAARIDATAPKIDAVLRAIHARSPHARIALVGYPVILPDDGGSCHDIVGLSSGDAPWVRDEEKYLNTMLKEQATTYGATYVDTYTPAVGHDVCRPAGERWIEPTDDAEAAGLHPNAAGERSMADATLSALGR
ncbi:GDSL-type esterase/lipase family protein [Streptomyces sp. DW26H14]|uniref:GDSL-type esterase/lipase family protein n=1 Tax=Streptomyces sp. DW26H14 TaxID=3435395 RepID=UPI00403DB4D6